MKIKLTDNEEKYLQKIPEDKKITIKPFNGQLESVAQDIMVKISTKFPDLEVVQMGASGLGISGQGDLDIYALCNPKDFPRYLPTFKELFDEPISEKPDFIEWNFEVDDIPVELYLTDPSTQSMRS